MEKEGIKIMSNKMKAAQLHKIGDFRTVEVDIPTVSGEELLLKVGGCGICGSDIPRIYDHGTSNQKYPMTIGHEFSGTIVAVGEKADPSLIGQRGGVFPLIPCRTCDSCQIGKYVMCSDYDYLGSRRDGGFAEYVVLPSAWHFIPSHNPETELKALAMVEPACVAQHAVRRANLSAGEGIVIIGAGAIGIMAARWAKIFGAGAIMLVDVDDSKVAFARERGFHAINSRTEDPVAAFRAINGGKDADVAIEGTGFSSALENCIAVAKPMGRIVLLGNPGQTQTAIAQKSHSNILRKELQILGTWNSNYSPFPINEWQYTVKLMDEGVFEVTDLITHTCDLDELPALCDGIKNRTVTICKAMCLMEE